MKIVIFLLFGIWLLEITAFAAVVGSTDDAMTIGGGARPLGMGRVFVAIADDADTQFINPGGLGSLKAPQAMTMFTNLMGEVYYMEYCGAVPTANGTFGIGYITTGVNNIPTTPLPSDYYDSVFVLSYGVPLARYFSYGKNTYVGLSGKIFSRGYTGGINNYGSGFSADIGVKLAYSPYLSFGLSRQNVIPVSLGSVISYNSGAQEALSSITKAGVAVKPVNLPKLLLGCDIDLPMQSGLPTTGHLGVEWKENKNLSIRAGLDQSVDSGNAAHASWDPTFGTSFSYGGFRVDYAYHQYYNDPGLATSYVSISYVGEPVYALKGKIE